MASAVPITRPAPPASEETKIPTAPSLAPLTALIAPDLARVNQIVLDRMVSRISLVGDLARHIIAAGGKRLRPMITLATARLCGYQGERHLKLAACVEFIHTATLLHDDVVDESELRRGEASANALWGNQASVLVGDFLFSRSFQLMVEDGSLKVLDILSTASAVIAEGEVHQLMTANNLATTEQAYLEVIGAKTAALFAAAARIGAVVAERAPAEEAALEGFGHNLGMAFQLVDDALDYSAAEAELGKTVGDDFREGKLTLPVILAFARGSESERAFWRRVIEESDQRPEDLAEAQALIQRHGALAETLQRARDYAAKAREGLNGFPDGPERRALAEAVDFAVTRAY